MTKLSERQIGLLVSLAVILGGLLLVRGTAIRQVFWAAAIPALIATAAAASVTFFRRGDPR